MARVSILIGGHLCTAPRPVKEATALARVGHVVTVFGVWSDPLLAERDRTLLRDAPFAFAPVLDLRPSGVLGRTRRLRARLEGRAARELFLRSGRFSPPLLGPGIREMLAQVLAARADLSIVHSESGMWVGRRLLDAGLDVGVDFEDWFSRDLLPEDRRTRPVVELERLERELAQRCVYATAASGAMADGIAGAYGAARPAVIYNAFPRAASGDSAHAPAPHDRRDRVCPSLHWFSQTIGPGRGLELLMRALPRIRHPLEVHLRGDVPRARRAWLDTLIPPGLRDRVHVHPTVPGDELPARIAEHDVGLALEIPYCANRDLTVTNKMFQYFQAGLAVIATDTVGQREVLGRHPAAGALVRTDDPGALAAAIDRLVSDPSALRCAKLAAGRAGESESWEHHEPRLRELAEQALRQGRPGRGAPVAAEFMASAGHHR